jgi:hypothetical protein
MSYPDLEVAPPKKRNPRDPNATNNDDLESILSPNESISRGGMTTSRSSSLTLPQAPPIPGVTAAATISKDDKFTLPTQQPPLPPQPATVNGVSTSNLAPGLGKGKIYDTRIYGFKVSERAKSGPRMRWLRSKPIDMNELDEARLWHERYGGNVDGDPDDEAVHTAGDIEDNEQEMDDEVDDEEIDEEELEVDQDEDDGEGVAANEDEDGDAVMASQPPPTTQQLKASSSQKGKSKREPEPDAEGEATMMAGQGQGTGRGKSRRKSGARQSGVDVSGKGADGSWL